jgi:hypothetical protein
MRTIFKLILVLAALFSFASAEEFKFEIGENYIFKTGSNEVLIFKVVDKKEILTTLKCNLDEHELLAVFVKTDDGFDVSLFQDKKLENKIFVKKYSEYTLKEYSKDANIFYGRTGFNFTKLKTP